MLHEAFKALLAEKGFESISMQDIAKRSTVNRATFYDHLPTNSRSSRTSIFEYKRYKNLTADCFATYI